VANVKGGDVNPITTMLFLLLAIATTGFAAGGKTVTFFSDGALVEIEAIAAKGVVEIRLPGGILADSLRIAPLAGAVIRNVEQFPSRQDGKVAKELDQVLEQKNRLNDRLQALETREEIFRAAAKSQSAKTPRKTKTNPDPMQSIRQGTEIAIAQLEAVYTARRKTEQEIRRLDARISGLKRGGQGGGAVVRVTVVPKNGRVKVCYALEGEGWAPRYDLHLNSAGRANLTLYGQVPAGFAGYLLHASPANLAAGNGAQVVPVTAGSPVRLAEYHLPVREESFGKGVRSDFSIVLTNSSEAYLPAGGASLYRNGEFWGRFRFEGISSARSRKVGNQ
jgi:hypothetical protein